MTIDNRCKISSYTGDNTILGCGVASVVVRRSSVSSASACCKAGPSSILASASHREVFPTDLTSDEERDLGEWQPIKIVLYECD